MSQQNKKLVKFVLKCILNISFVYVINTLEISTSGLEVVVGGGGGGEFLNLNMDFKEQNAKVLSARMEHKVSNL